MSKQRVIKPNEHVFIAGMTNSGKTYLAKKYLAGYDNVVALDTKRTLNWSEVPKEEVTLIQRLKDLPEVKTDKIVYRPIWEEQNPDFYNAFFKWIYQRSNTIVWVDELYSVSPTASQYPEYLKACYTQGRERGVGVWGLTQRPKDIALITMSEATHFFVFRLNLEEDRKRISKIAGVSELMANPTGKHTFWYYQTGEESAVIAKLKERGNRLNG